MPALQKVLLHLFVASGAISVTPAVAGAVRPQILVLFRNDARAEQGLVDSAKAEVTRLYALIDVDLIWVTEVPTPEKLLHVICLVIKEPDGTILSESALGVTPAASGCSGLCVSAADRARVPEIQSANRFRPCGDDWPRTRSHARA